jgi:hypothetical protein
MNIEKATEKYETWLGKRIPLLKGDLNLKHKSMREAVFPFLRATFYRWSIAGRLPVVRCRIGVRAQGGAL